MTTGDVDWLRVIISFGFVIALMIVLTFALKYISVKGLLPSSLAPRHRRLKISESIALDTRRRLVLIKCDDQEHLLLLSSQGDIVVQSNLPPPKTPIGS